MGRRDNFIWRNECPYCGKPVQLNVIEPYLDREFEKYQFHCDCILGPAKDVDIEYAYQNYLYDREENRITNFDKYFENKTFEDFNHYIDQYCAVVTKDNMEHYNEMCDKCKFGIAGDAVSGEYDCWKLCEWLQEKV